MKSLVSVLGVLLISSTSMAAATHVECSLNVLVADKGGYLMPIDPITVSDELDGVCNAKQVALDTNQVSICAEETDLTGVISIALMVDAVKDVNSTFSEVLLGTKKSDKKSLVVIRQDNDVVGNFAEKMYDARISFPTRYGGGDSLQLDDAVKAGMKKGVLTHDEPVSVLIDSCTLK